MGRGANAAAIRCDPAIRGRSDSCVNWYLRALSGSTFTASVTGSWAEKTIVIVSAVPDLAGLTLAHDAIYEEFVFRWAIAGLDIGDHAVVIQWCHTMCTDDANWAVVPNDYGANAHLSVSGRGTHPIVALVHTQGSIHNYRARVEEGAWTGGIVGQGTWTPTATGDWSERTIVVPAGAPNLDEFAATYDDVTGGSLTWDDGDLDPRGYAVTIQWCHTTCTADTEWSIIDSSTPSYAVGAGSVVHGKQTEHIPGSTHSYRGRFEKGMWNGQPGPSGTFTLENGGAGNWSEASFDIPGPPPTLVDFAATYAEGATLTWDGSGLDANTHAVALQWCFQTTCDVTADYNDTNWGKIFAAHDATTGMAAHDMQAEHTPGSTHTYRGRVEIGTWNGNTFSSHDNPSEWVGASLSVPPAAVPSAVTALLAPDQESLTLSWGPPSSGSPTGYDVRRLVPTPIDTVAAGIVATRFVYPTPPEKLAPGTAYQFGVKAVYSSSSASDEINHPETIITAPDAVSNVTAVATGTTSITVSWTLPGTSEYRGKTRITRSTSLAGTFADPVEVPLDATTVPITGLTPDTEYFFAAQTLKADISQNDGPTVKTSTGTRTTVATPTLDALSLNYDAIDGVEIRWNPAGLTTSHAVEVQWCHTSCDMETNWHIVQNGFLTTADQPFPATAAAAHEKQIEHTPGSTHKYRARVEGGRWTGDPLTDPTSTFHGDVTGEWAVDSILIPVADFDPPEMVTAELATDESSITVSWTAPSGSPTGYAARLIRPASTPLDVVSGNTMFVYSAVGPATVYEFGVKATYAGGDSPEVRTTPVVTAPGPVSNVGAVATGPTSITVSWELPTGTVRGETRVTRRVGPSGPFTDGIDVAEDALLVPITGLTPDTEYYFAVQTLARVPGQKNGPVVETTTGTRTESAVANGPPRNASAAFNGNMTRITVTWDAPSTGTPTSYSVARVEPSAADLGTRTSPYNYSSVAKGTAYKFEVKAVYAGGMSAVAETGTLTSPPGHVRNLAATDITDSSVRLTWDPPAGGPIREDYTIWVKKGDEGYDRSGTEAPTDVSAVVSRLEANTAYDFVVMTTGTPAQDDVVICNPVIAILPCVEASATTTTSTGRPEPSAPAKLRVALTTDSLTATLTWVAPSDTGSSAIRRYIIYAGSDSVGSATALTYAHTLTAGRSYSFAVAAVNAQGTGPKSNPVIVDSKGGAGGGGGRGAVPSPPQNLAARVLSASEIILTWADPVSEGDSPLIGYRILSAMGKAASFGVLVENAGLVNTYTHAGLYAGAVVRYRVQALNSGGASLSSNEVEENTARTIPDPPWGLRADPDGPHAIRIQWNAPAYTGGSPLTAYRIEMFAGSDWLEIESLASPHSTRYRHSDLEPGVEMTYRVHAINRAGPSEPSNVITARTPATLPNPPVGLTATAGGTDRIHLAWTPPAYDGGADITGYLVEARPDNGSWIVVTPDSRTPHPAWTHMGLKPGTRWLYRVLALNEAGLRSLPSTEASGRTNAAGPDAPTGFTAVAEGSYEVHLRWVRPVSDGGSRITGYRIDVSDDDMGSWSALIENSRSLRTEYAHKGVRPAMTLHYRVAAINAVGPGEWSGVARAKTEAAIPESPVNLAAIVEDARTIRLEWEIPADNGAEIRGYQIEVSYADGKGGRWRIIEQNTRTRLTIYTHEDLIPATTYDYRVAAINKVGVGEPSEPVSGQTDAIAPDGPADLSAEPISSTQVELTWTAPYDGGSEISAYIVERSFDGEEWLRFEPVGITEYVAETVAGVVTFFRVSARNEVGWSEPSDVVSAVTDDPIQRADRVNASILPRFSSVVTEDLVTVVSDRTTGDRGDRFRVSESRGEYSRQLGTLATWGEISKTTMRAEDNALDWEGSLTSYKLGADAPVGESLIAGLHVSRSVGDYIFTDRTNDREVEGTYVPSLNNITPYLGWRPDGALSAWVAVSYGDGKIAVDDELAGMRNTDFTMSTGAIGVIGGRRPLFVKVEGWQSTVQMNDTDEIGDLAFTLRRARALIEWMHSMQSGLDVAVSGGMRFDMNQDTENVNGFETGGSLTYQSGAILMRARGRALLATDTDYEEWGVSGFFQINRGGEGLSLEVGPSYGRGESNAESIWMSGVQAGLRQPDGRVNIIAGYRPAGSLVTSFGRFDSAQDRLVVGARMRSIFDWVFEGGYDKNGLGLSLKGGRKF